MGVCYYCSKTTRPNARTCGNFDGSVCCECAHGKTGSYGHTRPGSHRGSLRGFGTYGEQALRAAKPVLPLSPQGPRAPARPPVMVCRHCGRSKPAVDHFNWSCEAATHEFIWRGSAQPDTAIESRFGEFKKEVVKASAWEAAFDRDKMLAALGCGVGCLSFILLASLGGCFAYVAAH